MVHVMHVHFMLFAVFIPFLLTLNFQIIYFVENIALTETMRTINEILMIFVQFAFPL